MEFTKRSSGWRVSQRYNTDVLQGNWLEDRNAFQRGSHPDVSASIYRSGFQTHDGGREEQLTNLERRMSGVLRNDGIKPENLTHHHGKAFVEGQSITAYDQDFCRSEPSTHRTWDKWNSEWRPQRSDVPLQGIPTQTGALGRLTERKKREEEMAKQSDYGTTQRLSFRLPSANAFAPKRFATPRVWSTHLHPHIQNKSMTLRNQPSMVTVERFHLPDSKGQAVPDLG